MYYKAVKVTLENYKEVFSMFSVDIQDEVRSAILDDTDISRCIDYCADDSYKLGQFRMALREGIPYTYLKPSMTAKAVNNLRWCFNHDVDISQIKRYVNPKRNIDSELLESLCEGMRLGANINEVDFYKIPRNIVNIVVSGLVSKYPMEICEGVDWLDDNYVRALMRGMAMDIDVSPFVQEKWDTMVMVLLFSYSRRVNLNDFIGYISSKFNVDLVESLLRIYEKSIPIDILASKDERGLAIYNTYQVEVLQEAVIRGYDIYHEVFNPTLSDMQMQRILDREAK